ncbi:MAG: hypothetical protein ACOCZK_06440 [Planctomycetota bacterium]
MTCRTVLLLSILALVASACRPSTRRDAPLEPLTPKLVRATDTFLLDWQAERVGEGIVISYTLNGAPLGSDAAGIERLRAWIPTMPPSSTITIIPYRAPDDSYPFDAAALAAHARAHDVLLLEPEPYDQRDEPGPG